MIYDNSQQIKPWDDTGVAILTTNGADMHN